MRDDDPYSVRLLFHPTNVVRDRGRMQAFLKRVFNAEGRNQGDVLAEFGFNENYPNDYSLYTWIADVWLDSIQPELYVIDGQPAAQPVQEERLVEFGWYIDGLDGLQKALTAAGVRSVDQYNRPAPPDHAPVAAAAPDMKLMWTDPATTGVSYELMEWSPERSELFARIADARFDPHGTLPPPSPHDPLGIEHCSHHTVLTRNLPRALRLVVDVLGGTVVHEDRNDLLGTMSTWVWLKDSLLEYAVPDAEGTRATASLDGTTKPSLLGMPQEDRCHLITWKVRDLEAVEQHLANQRIRLEDKDTTTLITDPADTLGVRWGFTTAVLPGDPRQHRVPRSAA